MNMGNSTDQRNKKSVFGFMMRGMEKIGLGSIFGENQNNIIRNLRKNSKSERVILKSEEFLYESEDSPDISSQESSPEQLSKEM